jgi:hypothetical protein
MPVVYTCLQNTCGQFTVGELDVAVDVVYAAAFAMFNHHLDAAAMVVYVHPAAHVPAITVERDLSALKEIRDEQRLDPLQVLVWAVVVAAAGDTDVYSMGASKRPNHEVASGLHGGIRGIRC